MLNFITLTAKIRMLFIGMGLLFLAFPSVGRCDGAEFSVVPKAGYTTLVGYDQNTLKTLNVSTTYVAGIGLLLDGDISPRTEGWLRFDYNFYQFYPPPNYQIINTAIQTVEGGAGLGYALTRTLESLIEVNYAPMLLLTATGNSSSQVSNPFWIGIQGGLKWVVFRIWRVPFKLQADFTYFIPQTAAYQQKLNYRMNYSAATNFTMGRQDLAFTAYYSQTYLNSSQISYNQTNYEMGLKVGISFHLGEGESGSGGVKNTGGGVHNACPAWCEKEHL